MTTHPPLITRRRALQSAVACAAALWSAPLWAFGDKNKLVVPLLTHSSSVQGLRKGALRRLVLEVEKRTSVAVNPTAKDISLGDKKLFEHPLLVWAGKGAFSPLTTQEVDTLRKYLKAGGMLFVDSSEGVSNGPFLKSIQRELKRVYPKRALKDIPKGHVLYKSFYLIPTPVGRLATATSMQGIFEQDRLSVVVGTNDLLGALAKDNFGRWGFDVVPGGEGQREMAFRLGINVLMYALCINYKADQVHIPFILKRRKWKVE